jgi:methionine biosynthesis protein MetW
MIPAGPSADVGCGDGELLQLLRAGIDGRIELSRAGVNRRVAKGLAVAASRDHLVNYPDDAFDYVILSRTLQAPRKPKVVLENPPHRWRAVVSFPNFGFGRCGCTGLSAGTCRAPKISPRPGMTRRTSTSAPPGFRSSARITRQD